ncbi:MAG: aminoacetone oxidase family FAD-binding enzyme [Clostridia bacterium]|nr:aminoacetone oxidase family FAD-binding enzyme [Clostridia bacterium]
MEKIYKVAVIGGGAAGLTAGIMLSEKLRGDVIILERLPRVGKKITVTGNGRGNITNENLSADNYHSVEGDAQVFVRPTLKNFGNVRVKEFFTSLGALVVSEGDRVYPASLQASSLLDLMRLRLEYNECAQTTDFEAVDIERGEYFTISSADGRKIKAEKIVLAAGGKCQKQLGTDGSGYKLARLFGHTVTECYPSLVQLKTDASRIKRLKGIRQEVRLTLLDGTDPIASERGDLLFTEFGVSGNAVFGVSGYAATAKKPVLSIEFLPDFAEFELASALGKKIKAAPYLAAEDLLTGFVNKQIGRAIVEAAGVDLTEKCPKSHVNDIIRALKEFRLSVTGSLGFNYAQVTRGGVRLAEVDNVTLRSKKTENLYLAGEILDIDGDCGGYNLQWAFSSAYAISRDIFRFYGLE